MDPREKALLEEVLELSRKNNKILHGMQVRARFGAIFKFAYWVVFIGVIVWGTYYLQPYIKILTDTYNTISGQVESLQNGIQGVTNTIQKFPIR